MRIERHDDPAEFFALVAPFLERREAQHNLQLGFRPRLEDDRHAFGSADPLLYSCVDGAGEVAAVAVQTPPFGLILSEVDDPALVEALADRLAADGATLPTVAGPVEVARTSPSGGRGSRAQLRPCRPRNASTRQTSSCTRRASTGRCGSTVTPTVRW